MVGRANIPRTPGRHGGSASELVADSAAGVLVDVVVLVLLAPPVGCLVAGVLVDVVVLMLLAPSVGCPMAGVLVDTVVLVLLAPSTGCLMAGVLFDVVVVRVLLAPSIGCPIPSSQTAWEHAVHVCLTTLQRRHRRLHSGTRWAHTRHAAAVTWRVSGEVAEIGDVVVTVDLDVVVILEDVVVVGVVDVAVVVVVVRVVVVGILSHRKLNFPLPNTWSTPLAVHSLCVTQLPPRRTWLFLHTWHADGPTTMA